MLHLYIIIQCGATNKLESQNCSLPFIWHLHVKEIRANYTTLIEGNISFDVCVCVLYFYMVMQQHNTTMATMMWKGIINKCCNSNKNNNSGSSNSSSINNNIIIILIDIININNNNKPLSYSIVLILYRKHSLTLHSTIPYISIFKTKQRNEETKQLDLTQRRKIKDKHERSSCSMNKMLATLSMTSKQSCLGFVF